MSQYRAKLLDIGNKTAKGSNSTKYTEDSQYKYGIGFFRLEGAKFCGESFTTKTHNTEFCSECRNLWRNSFKGNYTRREEAKPLIIARRKCNDYPERE